ncbi:MAG TPA: hypothetical protein VGI13_08465 [Candidatus Acidoferrum sp.]|nr:hypothetical protein [Candidatus Acidoferrales bacterium]
MFRKKSEHGAKRKTKKLEKGNEARRRARVSGLKPAATRIIADKRKKAPKHKPDLLTTAEE